VILAIDAWQAEIRRFVADRQCLETWGLGDR